jgi:hypothetical protein
LTTFGLLLDQTEPSFDQLDDFVELALRAERLGFDRLWLRAGSSTELAFCAGALAARTRRIGLGLIVPTRPVGLPRGSVQRLPRLGRQVGRNLAVGVIARPYQRRAAAFAIGQGCQALCSGSPDPATRGFWADLAHGFWTDRLYDRQLVTGTGAVSLVFPRTTRVELTGDIIRAEGNSLGENLEIVFDPHATEESTETTDQWLERLSLEILPLFRPLPLVWPPPFI